jgi:hypothetical protein
VPSRRVSDCKVLAPLKEHGWIDVLDDYLGPDGLDITLSAPQPKQK